MVPFTPKVYISGALTGVPNVEELKQFYEAVADLCTDTGYDPYLPHQHSDPIADPNMTPADVDRLDRDKVTGSDLVLLYADVASFGVGIELEIANEAFRPVVVFHTAGKKVSRLLLGNPAVKLVITFTDFENALVVLRKVLNQRYELP